MAGTYQLLKNGKARLQYMYKGDRYSNTVEAKNDKEASVQLAKFVTAIRNNQVSNSNMTYLVFAQKWLDEYVRPNLSPTVVHNYKMYLNNRILPYLGNKKLKDIDVNILRNFFNDMKTWKTNHKPPRENTPISRGTYEKLYNIITGSLQKAYEWEIIPTNPCKRISLQTLRLDRLPSEIEKRKNSTINKIRAYDKNTYHQVLNLLNNSNNSKDKYRPQKVCAELILKTGLCISELAGLEWERDWDKDNSTISVSIIQVYIKGKGWIQKEPKEPARTRILSLSRSCNNMLIQFRNEYPKEKFMFFELINFNSYTDWLKRWQKDNNIIPILTAHEFRHSHATLLLQAGTPIKYISKRLGHANTQITENVYIEYLPEHDEEVALIIDEI